MAVKKAVFVFTVLSLTVALSARAFGLFSYADCADAHITNAYQTQICDFHENLSAIGENAVEKSAKEPKITSSDEKTAAEITTAAPSESSGNDDLPEIGTGTMLLIALCTFSVGSLIVVGIVGKLRKKNII